MFAFLMILFFTALMIGAVWLSRVAADKHRQEVELKQRARTIKQRLDEIASISQSLLQYDGDRALLDAITDFRIQQVKKRLEFLEGEDSEGELSTARAFKDNLPELIEQRDSELPDNDSDINHMKRQLFKAIKLIKLMQSQGYMMDNEVSEHVRRLKVITLKTEVNAYIQQGRQYVDNDERTTAATYFKHAKEMLVASELSFPDRARMIKRISKMIMGLYSTQEDEEELDKELGFSKQEREEIKKEASEHDSSDTEDKDFTKDDNEGETEGTTEPDTASAPGQAATGAKTATDTQTAPKETKDAQKSD